MKPKSDDWRKTYASKFIAYKCCYFGLIFSMQKVYTQNKKKMEKKHLSFVETVLR